MEYLLGSKKDFHDFVDSISKEDKVGIATHTDVDGIVSGIFLQKILESRNSNIEFIEFLNYGFGALKTLLEKDFDYLFFSDFNADEYEKDLELLREKGKVLILDHHPLNENLENKEGVLKTESKYCSSHTLFDLAKEGNYFDTRDFEWLAFSAIVLDYTFTDDRVFEFLKNVYPEIEEEKVFESEPGKKGKIIDNALIYYRPDFRKVYDLVLKKDLGSLNEVSEIVEDDIQKSEKKYLEIAEFYPEKNFYFGFYTPEIARISSIISKISHENPDKIFIMAADSGSNDGFVKISARAQSGTVDLGKILKKSIEGFEDASAGGHKQASAASFPKKYLEEFKKNILNELC